MWESHADFSTMLEQIWNGEAKSCSMPELKEKLAAISRGLAGWGDESFGSVRHQIRQL